MAHSQILQRINGILRISENNSISIISDYGDFSVSMSINPTDLDQMIDQQVVFDLCSQQDGGIQVNNIEFVDPPNLASVSPVQQNHPKPLGSSDDIPQNNGLSVSDIPEELICSICQEVLRDPVVLKCDHLFCRECISQWIKSRSACPMDRKPAVLNDLKSPPRYLTNILDSLKVRCDHHGLGCKIVVPLANLETHMKECPFGNTSQRSYDLPVNTSDQTPLSIEESSAIMDQNHEQWYTDLPVGTPQLSLERFGDSSMIWRPQQLPMSTEHLTTSSNTDTELLNATDNRPSAFDSYNGQWPPSDEFSESASDSLNEIYQYHQSIRYNADDSIDALSVECTLDNPVSSTDGLSALSADFRHDPSVDSVLFDVCPAWSRDHGLSRYSQTNSGICEFPFRSIQNKKKRESKYKCTLL